MPRQTSPSREGHTSPFVVEPQLLPERFEADPRQLRLAPQGLLLLHEPRAGLFAAPLRLHQLDEGARPFRVDPRLGANDPRLRAVDPHLRANDPRLRRDRSPAPGPDSLAPRNESGPPALDAPPPSPRSPAPGPESRAPNRKEPRGCASWSGGPPPPRSARAEAVVRYVEWSQCSRYFPQSSGHEQGSRERYGETQLGKRTPAQGASAAQENDYVPDLRFVAEGPPARWHARRGFASRSFITKAKRFDRRFGVRKLPRYGFGRPPKLPSRYRFTAPPLRAPLPPARRSTPWRLPPAPLCSARAPSALAPSLRSPALRPRGPPGSGRGARPTPLRRW